MWKNGRKSFILNFARLQEDNVWKTSFLCEYYAQKSKNDIKMSKENNLLERVDLT